MAMISIRLSDTARLTSPGPRLMATVTFLRTRLRPILQSTWCVINGGHYKVLHTEPERMALRCVACGHTTPGWAVGSPRLTRTTPADRERLRVARPRMVA
jgi:hypothetical protein